MKPDLIVAHPKHLLYPLWNKYIRENRDRFTKVIIVMTDMSVPIDYTQYLKDWFASNDVTIIANDPVTAQDDWRNIAVNKGLSLSDSEWVLFTEQDFLPEFGFWNAVYFMASLKNGKAYDFIDIKQDSRIHPCFILIKRSTLDKTSKDFSANPPHYDHFGKIQKDLEETQASECTILGLYEHMNGLSQNLYLLQIGEEPNYRPEDFKEYCRKCLELPDLHPDFRELFSWYLGK